MGESDKHRKRFSVLFYLVFLVFSTTAFLFFQNCAKSEKYEELTGVNTTTDTENTEDTDTTTETTATTTDSSTTTSTTTTVEGTISLNDSLISTGEGSTCAIKNKKLYCWGYNNHGQVSGDGETTDVSTPQKIVDSGEAPFDSVIAVSSNQQSTCFIDNGNDDKTGEVWCWGDNTKGELGNGKLGNDDASKKPAKIDSTKLTITNASKITSGAHHTCVIDSGDDDSVKCWGLNTSGQVGLSLKNKKNKYVETPHKVMIKSEDKKNKKKGKALTGVTAISAGNNHTCAIKGSTLWCWGDNEHGQLNDKNGNPKYRYEPEEFKSKKVKKVEAVAAGHDFTCVLTKIKGETKLRCWGDKFDSLETTTETTTTTTSGDGSALEDSGSSSIALFANTLSVCRVKDGTLKCFDVRKNKKGDPNWKDEAIDFSGATDSTVTSVSRGNFKLENSKKDKNHFCAFLSDGDLYCWGPNDHHQASGDSTSSSVTDPTKVTLTED